MNDALTQAQQRLRALHEQHEQARADANQPDPSADLISDLQEQVRQAQADAYLAGKSSDTSKLEAKIAAARKASSDVNAKREGAHAAALVLAERVAKAEAEVNQLTLDFHTTAYQEQRAAYLEELAEFSKLAGTIHGALAKVHARAIVLEQLAERLGLRGGAGEFVQNLLVDRLKIPTEVSPGTWYAVDAWEPVSEKSRPLHAKLVADLAQAGVDVSGPVLVKPTAASLTAPIEPRPVTITVAGNTWADPERGPSVVAGLVASV